MRFTQMGREITCAPGGFLLERADEPYRFSHDDPNDLFVLKVARSVLAERIGQPDRFCARIFDGRGGTGGLFSGMVRQVDATDPEDERGRAVLGRQLVELLALALDCQAETGRGPDSPVRAAHLKRAQDVIRRNLADPGLSPQGVADALGISKRYLHLLFAGAGLSVQQYLRDQRLIAARDLLDLPGDRSIADIAYRFGFSDQAQFARLFRTAFGESPSGYRARVRQQAAG
ncbi:MAG TPA: helix-turn-helix domain-containing protein [Paracoccus sp. (in: a-proteobacteria)]|nr:helix-turn-helix domain-containing protein [Paracoccus sp. (in: a-proteobacteria)]